MIEFLIANCVFLMIDFYLYLLSFAIERYEINSFNRYSHIVLNINYFNTIENFNLPINILNVKLHLM